ncbi:MAG: hypothetical protein K6B74_11765 [Ruminococcus sp.]|nr:hypothetical protein [Ruminococcus sp.]
MGKEKKSTTYSAKTELHDEHKHLFGSGGKSDFIVNMTPDGARKLCGVYSMIAMILMALASVPYYLAKQFEESNKVLMLRTENNGTLAFLIMTVLILAGFMGLLTFMIACVKKEVIVQKNKGLALFVLVIISSVVSMALSHDPMTSLYGYLDRGEGVISLIGYVGFFAIGVSITSEKWRSAASGTIIGIGTANGLLGILQSIPALKDYIPSYYNYLFIGYRQALTTSHTAVTEAEYFNSYAGYDASYAADGVTTSPFALAALLTVAVAFAVNRSCYTKKLSERLICLACTGVMFGAAVVTQTVTALIGMGGVLLATLIFAVTDRVSSNEEGDKNAKKTANKGAVVMSFVSVAMCGAIIGGIVATDNFRLRDEHVMFTDSYERLGIAPYQHTPHEEDIYSTLRYETWLRIEDNLVFGIGPDNWGAMYADGQGMEIDRTYNEYEDVLLTRGIVGAAIYFLALILTFVKAVRAVGGAHSGKYAKSAAYGAAAAYFAYLVQAFFNSSCNTSTPFFMLTVGLLWSYEASTGKPVKAAAKTEKE